MPTDPNNKSKKMPKTPEKLFLKAIKENNLEDAKSLMTIHNFNLDEITNRDGETALHLAARLEYHDLVKYLIERGININLGDDYGDTALHCAAREGRLEVVGTLLIHDGHTHLQNDFEETAEDLARKRLTHLIPKNIKKDLLTWCLFHMKPSSLTQSHTVPRLVKTLGFL